MSTPAVALTIAGTDSSGGAGVHADLRAFAAHRVHGASVIAALTAQSTTGIHGVHLVPAEFVVAQLDAVLGDLTVAATKTGFLASAENVEVVARAADAGRLPGLVVDPVLVTAAGIAMFPPAVTQAYRDHLMPAARVLTPNRVEAGVLLDRPVRTVADMEAAALDLLSFGAGAVVVKGGDASDEGDRSIDILATAQGVEYLDLPRIETSNDHGSGCSFSAAIAARLALGEGAVTAIRAAKVFVHRGLDGARDWHLGDGHGPIDALDWSGG